MSVFSPLNVLNALTASTSPGVIDTMNVIGSLPWIAHA